MEVNCVLAHLNAEPALQSKKCYDKAKLLKSLRPYAV